MPELRIPSALLAEALSGKRTKALRLFASAKLEGHRSEIKPLCECLSIKPKTCSRLIKNIINDGWAGTDGVFLFPRSWQNLGVSKRRGLYLIKVPLDLKRFEALAFAMGLKRFYRIQGSQSRSKKGRATPQTDFPTGYLADALGLKERRFKTLKARAQRYKYISVIPQSRIIGKAENYHEIKSNLHGPPVFKRGKHVVTPEVSKIRVLI